MSDFKYLKASDGTGEAVLAHVDATRAALATTLVVDSVDNWPDEFICTTGELLPSGLLDPSTMTQFKGHLSGGDIIIDEIEAGYTDNGNTTDEVAIIKQTSGWADLVAEALRIYSPSGMVSPYAGSAAPDGWLLCNGASLLRATYPDLFTAIGTTFGAADGTHFNVPDMRGRSPLGVGTGTYAEAIAAADVTTGTDQLTISTVGGKLFFTGQAVVLTTSGGAPAGLTAGNTYYVIWVDATHIKLATTRALAVFGTAIDITTQGTGTHTLTQTLTARALADKGGEEDHSLTTAELASHRHAITGNTSSSGSDGHQGAGGAQTADNNQGPTQYAGGSGSHNNMSPFLALNYIIKV